MAMRAMVSTQPSNLDKASMSAIGPLAGSLSLQRRAYKNRPPTERFAKDWIKCSPWVLQGPQMATANKYRIKAAEFYAQAQRATSLSPHLRVQFENLAKAYLRLAEQADRNAAADIVYEPPPPRLNDSDSTR